MARRQPEGRRVLRPGPEGARPRHGPPWWPSARPGGPACGPRTTRPCATWSRPRPRRSASWPSRRRSHVVDALRTTLDEAVAMVADSVELPAGQRPAGLPRRRALLRRLQGQPGVHPARSCRRPRRPGPRRWCCATPTGARCPTRWSASSPTVLDRFETQVGRPLPQRQRLRGGQLAGRRAVGRHPRAGLRQRLRRAGRQRRPGRRGARPVAQAAGGDHPGRTGCALLTPVAHHIAELVNIAPNPQQPFVGRLGVRPQGRPAHLGHRPPVRRLRAHLARPGRQRHPVRGVGDGRPVDAGHEGRGARPRARLATP